ncbi:alpha/beta hydrolase [Cupriavidus sp. WKF15]|uniref:alpha/beta fold hydrolase n=1 Tax=Cupriavidus sp. WKF15 TaxID=3032282 RepID=UPI0023E0C458|nr:alpha/beta hydrolase [Cupriavidus sp. WKF15]WER50870.1 alpha/beta hydrolase [Cupriavidus sp. WKF15]
MTAQHQDRRTRPSVRALGLAAILGMVLTAGCVSTAPVKRPAPEIGHVDISSDMQLRRMVVRNDNPKGTVLLLHGFPETLHAWDSIAAALGTDYEVHAFDWPGYGESSRPSSDSFAYAPADYAKVLKGYIEHAGIDKRNLVIYATDIGALPALLAAIDDPAIAKTIVVGDFAPFNRPQYMQERLQALKNPESAEGVRAAFNRTRDEILENAFTRGLPPSSGYALSAEYKADMARGWQNGPLTSADAFYHYYSHFTRDQHEFEANIGRLKTPVKVIWGEQDIYIKKEMGIEFARKINAPLTLLAETGHYPHLQHPQQTADEIRAAFR